MPERPDFFLDKHARVSRFSETWGLGPIWEGEPTARGPTATLGIGFDPYNYALLIELGSRVSIEDTFLTVTHLHGKDLELRWSDGPREPTVGIQTPQPKAAAGGVLYFSPNKGSIGS